MPATDSTKTPETEIIDGISDIIERYDHFILDMYGVVHNGIEPFPGTMRALEALNKAGKQICMLSNSPRRAESANAQMAAIGIPRNLYHHTVTSGEATFQALKHPKDDFHKACGKDCLFVVHAARTDMLDMVEGLDLKLVNNASEASFILNALPDISETGVTWLREQLQIAKDRDIPMICSNPDLIVYVKETLQDCAGTFALEYEQMGGRVFYPGKPHEPVYERCHELLGTPDKSRMVMIGDSLRTDIAGACRFGIDSIFNLVGIHRENVRKQDDPTEIDPEKLYAEIGTQEYTPTFAMNGFDA